ncbi:MAG: flagellar biosynthetic protein FliR, partial [Gammaproteobacteria bacterium]|nr:flagellar biosynthetic protein FliR [Gammaproteobacteria bacterium]
IMPVIPPSPVVKVFTADALQMAMQQILIGLMIGFVLQMSFGALVFAGQVVAFSMGLGFASLVDPQNGVQVPVISQFYVILATILFLSLDAHLVLIEILARSFHTFPVALDGISRNQLSEIVGWGSRMFSSGVLMALPIVAALLLVNLGMGIITRAAPQLNIFAVGFPLTILLGMLLMWSTLPNVLTNFSELLNEALFLIEQILGIAR